VVVSAKPAPSSAQAACADALTDLQRQCLIAVNRLPPSHPTAIAAAQILFALQQLAEQAYGEMGLATYNALCAMVDEVNVAFTLAPAASLPALSRIGESLRSSWEAVRAQVQRLRPDRRMAAMHTLALQVVQAHLEQVGYVPRPVPPPSGGR